MSKKISKILGVGLALGLLLSLLIAAVPVAATISQPMVDTADGDVSATTTYTISFQITEELTVGADGYITVQFPEDTDVGDVGDAVADIDISATSGIGSLAFSGKNPVNIAAITVDTDELTVKFLIPTGINTSDTIGAMADIQIKIADVENPTEPGDYVLSVKTGEETTYKESAAYEIESPTVGGGVYIYNASGVLVETFGGDAALDDAFDTGWFAKDDFTITVGPGTYLLTEDLIITGDGFTLESSDGAAETEIDCNELYGILINDNDVTIDGFKINDADIAVTVSEDDFVIINCDIVDADGNGPGILINTLGTDATIENCTFDDCPIAIEFADQNPIKDFDDVDITGNTITGCTGLGAIVFNGGVDDVDITNNTISGNDEAGIYFADGLACSNILIKGNTISENEEFGIRFNSTVAPLTLEISENTIADNDGDGIRIDQAGATRWTEETCVIIYNNFSGNTSDHLQNDSDVDVNAYFNWWGDADEDEFSGDIEEGGDGTIEYEPWLMAEFGTTTTSGDVKTNGSSLDAKDEANVRVSGVEDDTALNADIIAVAQFSENPEEALDGGFAFFDVFIKLDANYDTEDETIKLKFYDENIADGDAAFYWTGDFWVECSDQIVRSGLAWVNVTEDSIPTFEDLEGTAFAMVAGGSTVAAEVGYTCPQCGVSFDTEAELAPHWDAVHKPAPPVAPEVTVEVEAPPAPDVTVEAPAAAAPAYIWLIIGIGAVLVIAVIVLIVRTRRVV